MFGSFGKVSFVSGSKVDQFAVELKAGRLMGSSCKRCGAASFPPRADCPKCLSGEFELKPWRPEGTLVTYSTIAAAPTGFEDLGRYTVGVVDLADGGRLLAWIGESIPTDQIRIGMAVRVAPKTVEKDGQARVWYTLEKPG